MPISPAFVTRFFQLVAKRQFAEAERILERLKERIQKTRWNKGYFRALQGILLAQKSNNDRYAFLSNMHPTTEEELKNYRREFLRHAKDRLHADYDRGFFSAWADYMRVLSKMDLKEAENLALSPPSLPTMPSKPEEVPQEEMQEEVPEGVLEETSEEQLEKILEVPKETPTETSKKPPIRTGQTSINQFIDPQKIKPFKPAYKKESKQQSK